MNDRSIVRTPETGGQGTWLDTYLPDSQLTTHQGNQLRLVDIPAIRGILFRQRWLIAIVVAAAGLLGFVWTMMATPMYEARSSVRIEPYGAFIVEGQDVERATPSNQIYDMLQTQLGIITSRALASTVAEDLKLGERYDLLGADIDDSRPANVTDEEWRQAKQSMAASILHGSVSAELPERNWIIQIAYRSQDPAIAAEMANAYAAAFAASDTRQSVASNEYAQSYLREQIALTRQRLQEAEQAANAYARANGLILQASTSEDGEAGATLTSSNLSNINARVAAAQAARIEAEQRWRSIQNLPTSQLAEVQSNPLLQGLIAERTAKQAELVSLRQRYLDGHPQVATVLAQIETLDRQINQSGNDIKAAARTEYTVARNQEQALQAELASVTGATLAEQDRQVEYGVLEREAQALQDQLQTLLNRFNQVSSATNVQSGTVNLLDFAVVPSSPYSPNLMRNLVMALALGLASAAALALLRELLDNRIRSFEEVEERIGLPFLGHTPYVRPEDIESEEANAYSPLMEAYASIRSTIDFNLPREGAVIQLTSSQAGEGKSTTAMILAELFAAHGRKTLLVDGDLRRPSIGRMLKGDNPEQGIMEVLDGQADLPTVVVKGHHENLDILPSGARASNPGEVLASRRFHEFIEACRKAYSLVIFDSSPMLGLADAPMLAKAVDGTIFVVEANRAQISHVRNAIKRLRTSGGHPVGAILTKYRSLEAGQTYDYQYAYYHYGEAK